MEGFNDMEKEYLLQLQMALVAALGPLSVRVHSLGTVFVRGPAADDDGGDDTGVYLSGIEDSCDDDRVLSLYPCGFSGCASVFRGIGARSILPSYRTSFFWDQYVALSAKRITMMKSEPIHVSGTVALTKILLRNAGLKSEHGQWLGQALAQNAVLRSLDVGRNQLGSSGILRIVDGLSQNKTLWTLCLDNVRTFELVEEEDSFFKSRRYSEPVVDAFLALFQSTPMHLKHLDASDNGLESEELWTALGQWLSLNPPLECLNLENSAHAAVLLQRLNESFVNGNRSLRDLFLSQPNLLNESPVHLFEAGLFVCAPQLRRLSLSRFATTQNSESLATWILSLAADCALHLELSGISMKRATIQQLVECNSQKLVSLSISDCFRYNVSADCVVVQSLSKNSYITRLILPFCNLTSVTARALFEMAPTQLLHLDLSDNPQLGEQAREDSVAEGLDWLFRWLQDERGCRLQHLDLSGCRLVGGTAGSALGKALAKNTSLQVLYLGVNQLGDAGVQSLISLGLARNRTLKTLSVQTNRIASMGMRALLDALRSNRGLFVSSLDISDNIHSRDWVVPCLAALERNGHLLKFTFDIEPLSDATSRLRLPLLLSRNKKAHARAWRAAVCLLLIHRFRRSCFALGTLPRDGFVRIAKLVYYSRGEDEWWIT